MIDIYDDTLERPVRRGRPTLRQPLAPSSEPRGKSGSWWMAWPREGFTARCQEHRDRMQSDVIGRKVPDQILGAYIGLRRPVE